MTTLEEAAQRINAALIVKRRLDGKALTRREGVLLFCSYLENLTAKFVSEVDRMLDNISWAPLVISPA
ncbi:hypothetical protein [Sphaerochaeta halotolerans]|uniref:hypothetical protein n=1 Tax=Sphaerochaeta halotolerans TaxID=2293840 RepID=UPI001F37C7DF|nr:hypothetical protein [Sphaerochaeta halotolerans]